MSRHLKYIKIKIKTFQQIKFRIREKKEGNYTKTLAQASGHSKFSFARYAKKRFPHFNSDLCEDAMLVLVRMGTSMAAGNQQKHISVNFATKSVNLSALEELKNNKIILFPIQEVFR